MTIDIPRSQRGRLTTLFIQGYRFSLIGVLNGVIGLGTTYACYNLFRLDYRLANALGYTAGLTNSYILNKKWTFGSKNDAVREIILFFAVFCASYGLNLLGVIASVEIFKLDANVAQLTGVFLYTTSNFFGNKLLTFRRGEPTR